MGAYEIYAPCSPVTPSVTIVSNAANNSIAAGTSVTFTATPINGGTAPSYIWKKNGNNVGNNAATYTDATLANGDIINVIMASNATCASPTTVTSNAITMVVSAASNTRYVKHDATGANNGSSWANAYTDLQVAINASTAGNELWVASGTYYPSQHPDATTSTDPRAKSFFLNQNLLIYGGFAGTETQLSQRNSATNVTTLSGDIGAQGNNSDNCYHVLLTRGLNNTAVIDGFTIKGGRANSFTSLQYNSTFFNNTYGGGIFNHTSSPTLRNIVVSENNAINLGGGIYNENASPAITNTTISGNSVTNHGGGIANRVNSLPTLTNVIISSNTAANGGGIYNEGASASLINVTISGNTASTGGAIVNYQSPSTILTNVTISGNTAPTGSSIYNHASAPIIRNSIIWANGNNTLQNVSSSTPTFSHSIIANSGGSSNWNSSYGTNSGNNLDVNPLFTNAATNNFTLQATSPANNAGNNAFNTTATDLAGNARIQFTTIDMGAYESNVVCTPVTPSVAIVSNDADNSIVAGTSVTFTATPTNGGSLPTYQWKKNGNNVVGGTAPTYTDATLANGDVITVVMTSNAACATTTTVTSNAITMTVTMGVCTGITNRIYVTPNGTGNGSSWANAMNDLQAAINNTCSATEIWVAAGTYYPSQFPDTTKSADPRTKAFFLAQNMQLYGGFAGNETQLSQRNPATNVTTLSGDIGVQGNNSDNCYHVFLTAGFTYAITIDGFTVRDGNSILDIPKANTEQDLSIKPS
jgi:hypothetical protein